MSSNSQITEKWHDFSNIRLETFYFQVLLNITPNLVSFLNMPTFSLQI